MTKEVLVIDDNLDIRQLISTILRDEGHLVREAANFDQALIEIKKKLRKLDPQKCLCYIIYIYKKSFCLD